MLRTFSIPIILALLFYGCAQQGSPTGGAKDEDPPVVIEARPANYSNNFKAEKIFITFDEYIVLSNVNQELMVSPPFKEKPEIKLRNKTIIIEFEEELRENTTYTFNFGNSIKDLHEGNELINFEYVFATGEELDSLSVRGSIKNSFDLSAPEGPITIMLYEDLRDSVPLLETPLYVGKSGPEGTFSVNNLKSEVFKLFAIKDVNYNLLFDQPNEEIAFLDSNLIVSAEYFRQTLRQQGYLDSLELLIDSLQTMADSAIIDEDSLKLVMPNLNAVYVDLYLFTEKSELQFLTDYFREDPRKLGLLFNISLTDSFNYHLLEADIPNEELFLEIFSEERDSLILWIKDSTYYQKDTLEMTFNYMVKDSLDNPLMIADTIMLTYRKKESKQDKKKTDTNTEQENEAEQLRINTIRSDGKQELNKPLKLSFDFPVTNINRSLMELVQIPDSIEQRLDFSIEPDSAKYLSAYLHYAWESDMKYRLRIFPGAIGNLYDLPHDTIDVPFSGKDAESYGKIILNLENVRGDVIVQLIAKDKIVIKKTIHSEGSYEFPFLIPNTYKIKFIHDRNGNGKWDTGKYIKKLQPEKVEFLPIEITVRSNWDHDATHVLKN